MIFEKVESIRIERNKQIGVLRSAIEETEERIKTLNTKIEDATEKGDVDIFEKSMSSKAQLEQFINATKKRIAEIKKAPLLTDSELETYRDAIIDEYNPQFEKQSKKIISAVSKVVDEFKIYQELQNNFLRDRNTFNVINTNKANHLYNGKRAISNDKLEIMNTLEILENFINCKDKFNEISQMQGVIRLLNMRGNLMT